LEKIKTQQVAEFWPILLRPSTIKKFEIIVLNQLLSELEPKNPKQSVLLQALKNHPILQSEAVQELALRKFTEK